MRWRIGIDVGGTFTDLVAIAGDGGTVMAKAASTPADQSLGVLAGLANLAAALGVGLDELLSRTEHIIHGTTVATNALLERRGARVAMLTTQGHRDVVEMREGLKPDRYNLRMAPPEPLVPRHRRIPVAERLRADGRVETALEAPALNAAIAAVGEADAVAICFLHAWADPRHEATAAAALRAARPDLFVTASHEVLPEIKEFERFSTTAVNAYVGPVVARYLGRLAGRLAEAGYQGAVFVILSHGGVAPLADAARLAVGTALSGPAGGVAAAVALSAMGIGGELVTFDMGGTSTDIASITQGRATLGRGREVGGEVIALESLDIVTLGAGGGSIAALGPDGRLQVGPRSAGARPGPACYGRGGVEPAVTDANLVLGFLSAGNFLGGAQALDLPAAEAAMAALAGRLGIAPLDLAAGIFRLVNARMADGVRVATVRRGIDPRAATLLAFGGAAGLHASAVARDLGMKRYAVPLLAAGLSAWGMLRTDLRYEVTRSVSVAEGVPPAATLAALYARLEDEARQKMAEWFHGPIDTTRSASMRYGEQVFEIKVGLDGLDWTRGDADEQARQAFHAEHQRLFTYQLPEDEVVLVSARVAALGRLGGAAGYFSRPAMTAPGARRVFLGGAWREVAVHGFFDFQPGRRLEAPAIVESSTTTVLLAAGEFVEFDPRGWLMVTIADG